MGHQNDSLSIMLNAVFDGWQRRNDTLIIGDFIRRLLLLRDLTRQLSNSSHINGLIH